MYNTTARRPMPTVLQCCEHESIPLSYSSGSAESANQFSDTSNPSMPSSQSSCLSPTQLPKGARAPSPQQLGPHVIDQTPNTVVRRTSKALHSASPSAWKVEWRGFSRMVKWVIPSTKQKTEEKPLPPPPISPARHWQEPNDPDETDVYAVPEFDQSLASRSPNTDKFYIPVSPSNSSSYADINHGNIHPRQSQSDNGHSSHMRQSLANTHGVLNVPFPGISVIMSPEGRIGDIHTGTEEVITEHGVTRQRRLTSTTNYDREHSEYEESPKGDSMDAFSDISHSPPHARTLFGPYSQTHPTRAQSEIGHGIPSSSMTSTQPLSRQSRSIRMFSFSRSTPRLPTDSTVSRHSSYSVSGPSGPRKLRKPRAAAPPRVPPLRSPPPPSSFKNPSRISPSPSSSTSPLIPMSPKPPSRKLTKRSRPSTSQRLHSYGSSTSAHSVPPLPSIYHTTPFEPDVSMNRPAQRRKLPKLDVADAPSDIPNATSRPVRPSFLRTESNRRWTVAVAEVPDEMLVEELERLRRMGMRAGEVHGTAYESETSHFKGFTESQGASTSHDYKDNDLFRGQLSEDEDEMEWVNARRAMLCCRELVRTERTYLARLQQLIDGDTLQPAPPLLCQYLPALIAASKALSSQFNEDPSAWGVSSALLSAEEELEIAMVAWCGIVGDFFNTTSDGTEERGQKRRGSAVAIVAQVRPGENGVNRQANDGSRSESTVEQKGLVSPHGSYVSLFASSRGAAWKSRISLTNLNLSWDGEKESWSSRRSFKATKKKDEDKTRRKPAFRDLAIQPTQRITRYVLLYKDLLVHTPSNSPAHGIVQRAVECAMRIAQKCDRAQGNAAFLRRS